MNEPNKAQQARTALKLVVLQALRDAHAASKAWLMARRTGVGGTDLVALLRPFKSVYWERNARKTWQEKMGQGDVATRKMGKAETGKALEPMLLDWLWKQTGILFEHIGEGSAVHPDEPWSRCSLDARAFDDPGIIAEIKTTTSSNRTLCDIDTAAELGNGIQHPDEENPDLAIFPGEAEVREEWWVQCQWGMRTTGAHTCYLLVFFRESCEYDIYKISRASDEVLDGLGAIAKHFWTEFCLPGIEPAETQYGPYRHDERFKKPRASHAQVHKHMHKQLVDRLGKDEADKIHEAALRAHTKGE